MYSTSYWVTFLAVVLGLLILDLGVFNKKSHEVSIKEAFGWSAFWIGIAIAFGGMIYWTHGAEDTILYFTSYALEKSLSIDNLFVFILVFKYFNIRGEQQHKILYWGVLGALIMRGVFIYFGIEMISKFNWLLYVFGAFLVYSGIKLLFSKEDEEEEESKMLAWLKGRFGPFMAALLAIEISDVIFAVDSVPAVLSITQKPFIVYTSNIFAILGLRSLYFALNALSSKLKNMDKALSVILTFIGVKMLISHYVHIPSWLTLTIIIGSLTLGAVTSKEEVANA